jgi:hypothetical protein
MTDDTYHDNDREFSWQSHSKPSVGIVHAVADALDRPVDDLPQLARAVDPDALDALLDGGGASVSFQYAGVDVTAFGDGTLLVA